MLDSETGFSFIGGFSFNQARRLNPRQPMIVIMKGVLGLYRFHNIPPTHGAGSATKPRLVHVRPKAIPLRSSGTALETSD